MHCWDSSVVCRIFVADKQLAVVESLAFFICLVNLRLDHFSVLSYVFEAIDISKLLEASCDGLKLLHIIVELLLPSSHLLDKAVLLFIKEALLLLDSVNSLKRGTVDAPKLVILVFILPSVVELIQDSIVLDASLDFDLLFLKLLRQSVHVVFQLRQLLDALRSSFNLVVVLLKVTQDLV